MNWWERLRRSVAAFGQQPERSLEGYKKDRSSAPLAAVNFTIQVMQEIIIVRPKMTQTDNSINYGTRIQGDVSINGPVTDAFNAINKLDTSTPERQNLRDLLKVLHEEAARLIAALPDKDEAERTARNLRNLTEAATAKKPDRRWFEVSAEGLLEAAKAVASLTAPVTAAVKAVLAWFKD